jgi:hypothetical protein
MQVSYKLHTLVIMLLKLDSPVSNEQETGWLQSQYGHFGKEKKLVNDGN